MMGALSAGKNGRTISDRFGLTANLPVSEASVQWMFEMYIIEMVMEAKLPSGVGALPASPREGRQPLGLDPPRVPRVGEIHMPTPSACAAPGRPRPRRRLRHPHRPDRGSPPGARVQPTTTTFAQGGAPAALVAASSGTALIADDGPPISLTASDGTGLTLTRLDARAVVDGPLAFTELHLTFPEPEDRDPRGPVRDHAARRRRDQPVRDEDRRPWMEAEMVERMAARRAYEDFLHRRQDPALLEKEAGNEFSRPGVPDPGARRQGADRLATRRSWRTPTRRTCCRWTACRGSTRSTARVQVARTDGSALRWDEITLDQTDWQPDRDSVARRAAAPATRSAPPAWSRCGSSPELPATPGDDRRAPRSWSTPARRARSASPATRADVDALIAALARDHAGARGHGGGVRPGRRASCTPARPATPSARSTGPARAAAARRLGPRPARCAGPPPRRGPGDDRQRRGRHRRRGRRGQARHAGRGDEAVGAPRRRARRRHPRSRRRRGAGPRPAPPRRRGARSRRRRRRGGAAARAGDPLGHQGRRRRRARGVAGAPRRRAAGRRRDGLRLDADGDAGADAR